MKTRAAATIAVVLLPIALAACDEDGPDAYGNFEARDVVVSAEAGGRLLMFEAGEGTRIAAGQVVGRIDTADVALQRGELNAQKSAARTRTAEVEAQIEVLQAQLATAREEYERTIRLGDAGAATARQLTQAEGEVSVLERRIAAARAQAESARAEVAVVETRLARVEEQLEKRRVTNPVSGTVLTTWVESGEFVQPGTPLYSIAALDTLTLRAYLSGGQLAGVRIGDEVQVRIDVGPDALRTLPGRVVWIASEGEFTPTPIQTREERVDRVYATRIRVPNPDGAIKIGMPGEVILPARPSPPPESDEP